MTPEYAVAHLTGAGGLDAKKRRDPLGSRRFWEGDYLDCRRDSCAIITAAASRTAVPPVPFDQT
jgi:hypothetical protein